MPRRYFLTMRSPDSHFDFDLELAKEKSQDNPIYYAQYAHARICSILKQAKEQGVEVTADADFSTITNEKAIDLLKKIAEFEPTIESAKRKSRTTSFNKLYSRFSFCIPQIL